MIFLGTQTEALKKYSDEILCWLKLKIRGKYSAINPNGHNCTKETCNVCTRNIQIKTDLCPDFIRCLVDNNLNRIITSKPQDLINIEELIKKMYVGFGHNCNKFNVECKKLFINSGYEGYFYANLNYKLADWLDIHTCIYCNRQYTFVMRKADGKKGMVPQFDHWFLKKEHPLLALSFYNLIPSCAICNSSIKSKAVMDLKKHLHPYIDVNISSSFKFSYFAKSPSEFEVICQNLETGDDRIQNTIDILETRLLYLGHSKKELQDLIDLRYKYSENYLDILFNKTFSGIEVSETDKYRLIFGIEIDESKYHKRPFSKFKKDIVEKLVGVTGKS